MTEPTQEPTPAAEATPTTTAEAAAPVAAAESAEAASAPEAKAEPTMAAVAGKTEATVSLRGLIEAGVHFGHQTNRWNPRMAPYIYGSRNGIHIVDLDQTVQLFRRALNFITEAVGRGGQVLFVGTKRQAQEVIVEEAVRSGQFHVTGRWLGGTLTNFRTMKNGIDRLRNLEQMDGDGSLESFTKKEALGMRRDMARLDKFVGGIKEMSGPPAAMFVVDPNHEHIAVKEANKLNIPVVALTDTNCDPSKIDYVIPGNDDAIRAVKLITATIADACVAGQSRRKEFMQADRRDNSAGVSVQFSRGRGRGGNPKASA